MGNIQPSVDNAEHIGPNTTGDNIQAKRVTPYYWDGSNWQRQAAQFIDVAYDYIGFTNPDGLGNYQTWTFKSGGSSGTTVRTLTVTYDGSSNITSITRS